MGVEVSCELAKLDETNYGVAGVKRATVFIRFNPDSCDDDDELLERVDHLAQVLKRFCTAPLKELALVPLRANVLFLFYSKGGQKHVLAAKAAPEINVLKN